MPSVVTMTGPGKAVVTDDAALAITAQTAALTAAIQAAVLQLIGTSIIPGTLGSIDNKLELIAKQLVAVADLAEVLSLSANEIKTAQSSMVSLQQESNIMQSMAVSDQLDTNRFQTQVTNEALDRAGIPRPKMPPFLDTLKETLKKVKDFNILVEAEGLMKSATNKLTSLVKEQIGSFDATFGISDWIKQKTQALKAAILPSTRQAKAAIEARTKVTWGI
jgi:hypothetical protein